MKLFIIIFLSITLATAAIMTFGWWNISPDADEPVTYFDPRVGLTYTADSPIDLEFREWCENFNTLGGYLEYRLMVKRVDPTLLISVGDNFEEGGFPRCVSFGGWFAESWRFPLGIVTYRYVNDRYVRLVDEVDGCQDCDKRL